MTSIGLNSQRECLRLGQPSIIWEAVSCAAVIFGVMQLQHCEYVTCSALLARIKLRGLQLAMPDVKNTDLRCSTELNHGEHLHAGIALKTSKEKVKTGWEMVKPVRKRGHRLFEFAVEVAAGPATSFLRHTKASFLMQQATCRHHVIKQIFWAPRYAPVPTSA